MKKICSRCKMRAGHPVVVRRYLEPPEGIRYLCRRCAFLTGFEICHGCKRAWPECLVYTPLCIECKRKEEERR